MIQNDELSTFVIGKMGKIQVLTSEILGGSFPCFEKGQILPLKKLGAGFRSYRPFFENRKKTYLPQNVRPAFWDLIIAKNQFFRPPRDAGWNSAHV